MESVDRQLERRVRHKAKSLGYEVRKSRARQVSMNDLGEFMLVNSASNACVLGDRFNASLEEMETVLTV